MSGSVAGLFGFAVRNRTEIPAWSGQASDKEAEEARRELLPGVSAFYKDDAGEVFRTYSTYGRGVEVMMGTCNMLDLAPKGRNEAKGMDWVHRHDRYE